MLTAGEEAPIVSALERMLAMRAYMRAKTIDGVIDHAVAERVGLTAAAIDDMYQIMAIANYEDRFVIPTTHREGARTLMTCAARAASVSATRLRRTHRTRPLRVGEASRRQEPDGGRENGEHLSRARCAAELSDC
jgi:nitrate reductase beta subunit